MRVLSFVRFSLVLLVALAHPMLSSAQSVALSEAERDALHQEIRSYLLENPEILMEMYALLEQQQQQATAESDKTLVSENADALFDDGFSHVAGNPEGDFTIVEFLDYQCGFCRKAQPELTELIETDGNIRWIIKEFPILGPNSELASRAAISTLINSGEDAYERLHDAMMSSRGAVTDDNLDAILSANDLDPEAIRAGMEAPEVTERIAQTHALAETMGVSGTPTFIFGTELVRGYIPLEQMRSLVSEVRSAE